MEKYDVYNLDELIGKIIINANDFHYKKCYDEKYDDSNLLSFLKEDTNQFIPFFESRIRYLKQFNLSELKYATDNYKIVKVNKEVL